jgi:hypothetical protein
VNQKVIPEASLAKSGAHIAMKALTSNAPVDFVPRTKKTLKEHQRLWRLLKKYAKVQHSGWLDVHY